MNQPVQVCINLRREKNLCQKLFSRFKNLKRINLNWMTKNSCFSLSNHIFLQARENIRSTNFANVYNQLFFSVKISGTYLDSCLLNCYWIVCCCLTTWSRFINLVRGKTKQMPRQRGFKSFMDIFSQINKFQTLSCNINKTSI